MPHKTKPRAFKTKKFSKNAKAAFVTDADLCDAIKEVMAGQAVDKHFLEICHDDKKEI